MNAIGTKILKNILNENEKEFKGNLPMYRKERKTSVAFHVFTNQIVVVEIKNHKLYKITIEQNNVERHKIKKPKFIFIWLIPIQKIRRANPNIISKNPDGAIFFNEIKNWLSIGFRRTKSRVPSLICFTISVRFGLNQVLVIPYNIV